MAVGAVAAGGGGVVAGALGRGVAAGTIGGGGEATELAFATAKGSRYVNLAAKLTAREFQANLVSNGFKIVRQTVGSNGPVTVLSNGQKTYTIYTATSTGSARCAGRQRRRTDPQDPVEWILGPPRGDD
jgi:hypothetical protein